MAQAAVVLLSGGLDSATVLAMARERGYRRRALWFRYGQRHAVELESAQALARVMGVARHVIVDIDLRIFGGSALTADIEVPQHDPGQATAGSIPITYVPARNTIFLSYALAFAEVLDARDIFIGVNAIDYWVPGLPSEFIEAFELMANLAARAGVEGVTPLRIQVPLIALGKADIIRQGLALGVDYALTSSYGPTRRAGPVLAAIPARCGPAALRKPVSRIRCCGASG